MSGLDLSVIHTALFVRIDVAEYATIPGLYSPQVLTFSDHHTPFVIDGYTYTPAGSLMNITSTVNELRISSNTVTITLSGIPDSSIKEIVNSKIKNSPVTIYRGFFNMNGTLVTSTEVGFQNPIGRFRGFVNNYGLTEEYDNNARTATNTISLQCTSVVDIFTRKFTGRKTNKESFQRTSPGDLSMDRVSVLQDTVFDFGAPK